MKNTFILLVTILVSLFSFNIWADIETNGFQIMLAPKVAKHTAGYGEIRNTGTQADTLLEVKSEVASVMLHKTEIQSNHAHMNHLQSIVIEAGSSLKFEPMSYHLMLSDMSDVCFKEGETVTLFFEFEKAGIIEVVAPVVSIFY